MTGDKLKIVWIGNDGEQYCMVRFRLIKVMANENTFKIIDIEDAIARYKLGYISDSEALVLIQAAVSK